MPACSEMCFFSHTIPRKIWSAEKHVFTRNGEEVFCAEQHSHGWVIYIAKHNYKIFAGTQIVFDYCTNNTSLSSQRAACVYAFVIVCDHSFTAPRKVEIHSCSVLLSFPHRRLVSGDHVDVKPKIKDNSQTATSGTPLHQWKPRRALQAFKIHVRWTFCVNFWTPSTHTGHFWAKGCPFGINIHPTSVIRKSVGHFDISGAASTHNYYCRRNFSGLPLPHQ